MILVWQLLAFAVVLLALAVVFFFAAPLVHELTQFMVAAPPAIVATTALIGRIRTRP